ncbi:hypothetical protein [Ralstonia mannitolilytica]|uniref:Uncharacterized protein n=1 Tax=Ralstonia mannitolilytica TaxID=105219 RepID=A0AAJ4ZLF0_9RALS|nr:hypothetical protein [Ralstonia mannitolilytica]CAG2137393.1 hypothetical protein LMG6866_01618 [Ralstonia mannitolilytica]CAJ0733082.1 hypothetical protein R77592_03118 [Ralstonia mannitolilytica]SUD88011.1 Uncharacterised protein [Ralstonia mannitolilytica]SUD93920.1 Uncharacterised protein [Ralstonia mannitolilytica]SUD97671.1 Uncharacterised protein [Ralstonia mannitolilytica]
MTIRQALHTLLLGCCFIAVPSWGQGTAPVVLGVTAQLDGQSETQRVTLPADTSTGQHVALLEHTQSFDVGGSMPRTQWEERFAAGLPDDTITLGCDATVCQFMRHRWAKTGVDVSLRPMAASGDFQPLSIGVTLHRFRPSPDAESPAQVDTWTRNLDTSLRVGDMRTIDMDGRGVLTIERLAAP